MLAERAILYAPNYLFGQIVMHEEHFYIKYCGMKAQYVNAASV